MKQYGGFLSKEDLAAFYPEWVQPLTTDYHGYTVCEIPPNGHGITVLMALNILKGLEPTHDLFTETHRQIEAMKLAFTDAQRYVADPRYMTVSPEQLLSAEYAAARRELIGSEALMPEYWEPVKGGTVYLCTADREGNMVSYIQSNYMGFGSGVVIPGTGISLNNRGSNFYLDASLANCLGPGKKSYHTIIPGFLMKDGKPVGPFGIMGGFMQPQAHLQVLLSAIDHHLNPQDALDKPRWMWTGGKTIEVEQTFDPALLDSWHVPDIKLLSDSRACLLAGVKSSGATKTASFAAAVKCAPMDRSRPGKEYRYYESKSFKSGICRSMAVSSAAGCKRDGSGAGCRRKVRSRCRYVWP